MSFSIRLTKIQFIVDHKSLQYRIILLTVLLCSIVTTWLFFIYLPQTREATLIEQQMRELQQKNDQLLQRNATILQIAKSHAADSLMTKYLQLRQSTADIDLKLSQYRLQYIDTKTLTKLLYALLKYTYDLQIENFSTITVNPPVITSTDKNTKTPPATTKTSVADNAPTRMDSEADTTHYSLSLQGDYFAIMKFLQRVEQLQWQLFWRKLTYNVKDYPKAVATIEFYTLKEREKSQLPPVNK